jgi:hypothetical protein
MSILRKFFGRGARHDAASRMSSQPVDAALARGSATEQGNLRRELLRHVLRKTLNRHGIPLSWLSAEMLVATSRGRETGIHWRLLIKHWDPRLMTYAVGLQNSLITRLLSQDPHAADWLMGISWRYALPDESNCPAMPYPGFWTADPGAEAEEDAPREVAGGSGDVIAGPVRIATAAAAPAPRESSDSIRDDLDKLLAIRDAELQSAEEQYRSSGSEPTQPMYLKTEPVPLSDRPRRES